MQAPDHVGHRILVPLDGGERAAALHHVCGLVTPGSEILLLHVLDPAEDDDAGESREAAAQADLHEAAIWLHGAAPGVGVQTMIAWGEPGEVIHAEATRAGIDLIAMSSHGRGTLGRLTHGSVTDEVVRTTDLPILVCPRHVGRGGSVPATIQRLVVPHDGSEFAGMALPVVASLAARLGVPVLLVNAQEAGLAATPPAPVGLGSGGFSSALAEDVMAEAAEETRAILAAEQASLQGAGVTTRLHMSESAEVDAILDEARPDDVIVMASRRQGGLGRWLMGSTAEQLIHAAPCPILLVRRVPASG